MLIKDVIRQGSNGQFCLECCNSWNRQQHQCNSREFFRLYDCQLKDHEEMLKRWKMEKGERDVRSKS